MLSRPHFLFALTLLAVFGSTALRAVGSEESEAVKNPLVGKQVDILLRSGKTMKGVVVKEVTPGEFPHTISTLRVLDPATGSRPILGAAAVKRVSSADGKELLVFEEESKCLAPPDEDKLKEIRKAVESAKATAKHARSSSDRKPKSSSKKKSGLGSDEESRRKRNEQQRKEFFEKTGVWLWPELTEEQQKEALAKTKGFVAKVSEKFAPLNMRLYETRYYLFLSDLPPQIASLYTSCLDAMHEQLCQAFGIKNKDGVWLGGKAPVIAFVQGEHFAEFEREFFNHQVNHLAAQGLAHQASNGIVIISCHCGKDPYYFAGVIVHETTHGFVHRYKSPAIIPNWLNEGIAEWVSMTVVQNNKGVRQKVKAAIEQMRQTGALGPNFFTANNIAPGQYGIATAMVDFLLRSNPKAFRALIEGIKSGQKWQDALKKTYGVTPEELTQKFGMAVVGIPMLRP